MSNDRLTHQIDECFNQHIRPYPTVDDARMLEAVLPDDSGLLSGLAARCLAEARKAARAGHHTEARRFDIIGRQLQRLVADRH